MCLRRLAGQEQVEEVPCLLLCFCPINFSISPRHCWSGSVTGAGPGAGGGGGGGAGVRSINYLVIIMQPADSLIW